jgi:undecaprenyl-diphosphatase
LGSFEPTFRFILQGSYTKLILPLQNKSKIGQNNPKNRRTLNFERGLMHWLHALLLGLVQGLAEFFPISSSAHLLLLKKLLNLPTGHEGVLFDLFCHLGTLFVLAFYFRKDIWHLFSQQPRQLALYAAALTPLVPFYFLLEPVRKALSHIGCLGYCMVATAGLLFLAQRFKPKNGVLSLKNAFWIGTAQAIALIPGISRSAATITGGIWRGLSVKQAVRFSFLLSLPAVAGGTFLELLKTNSLFASPHLLPCLIGFTTAAAAGSIVIRYAIPWLEKGRLKPFAWYCLIVGIVLMVLL